MGERENKRHSYQCKRREKDCGVKRKAFERTTAKQREAQDQAGAGAGRRTLKRTLRRTFRRTLKRDGAEETGRARQSSLRVCACVCAYA
eukprot:6190872-Pleurochrysis_carterae.AAC.5